MGVGASLFAGYRIAKKVLPKIRELVKKVRANKAKTKSCSAPPDNLPVAPKPLLKSFDDVVANPKSLYGKSADEVAEILGEGWMKGHYGKIGTGWKFTKGDKVVFYHVDGHHVGPYYGYSSGVTGKVKIIGPGYKGCGRSVATPNSVFHAAFWYPFFVSGA